MVPGLDHLVLVKRLGISPKKVMNTIRQSTQCGVHTVLHPWLSRWFRTNDHQLWYRRLSRNLYSDTLFATTVSRSCNKCAQIFATDFGWSCLFSMKLKSKAHEVLSLLFQWDGVPPTVICDNAKEIVLVSLIENLRRHHVT